jgi:amidase
MGNIDDLLVETIQTIAPMIEAKTISPVELTEAMLRRIEKIDKNIGSYALVTPDLAIKEARRAESEIIAGNYLGALHGVPIALKDLIDVANVPTECASTILRGNIPQTNATVVEKLKAAGAITLGKLNLTEFALYGYHPEFTPPANPWNLKHWAGVSSSGSGAATAASLCYASLGTDTGGSIRFPSASCGVVGIKATFGKISRHGVFPLSDTLDHTGPIARCVMDAALMLSILEGRDPKDPSTRTDPKSDYYGAARKGLDGFKIGLDPIYCSKGCDTEMSAATFKAVDLLKVAGATIVTLSAPELENAAEHWLNICSVDALIAHKGLFPERREDYGPVFRALLEHGEKVTSVEYAEATRQRQHTTALINELLTKTDVIVCPAMPTIAGPQTDYPPQQVASVEDIGPLVKFAAPTNFSGHPSITIPNGFSANGIPTGMQFIGRHGDEASIIRAAAAYEELTDWKKFQPQL